MEQIILNVVIASGAVGILSNSLVNGVKYLSGGFASKVPPRVLNAIFSFVGVLALAFSGGTVDMTVVQNDIIILIAAGLSWVMAHFAYKLNTIWPAKEV